MSGLSVIIPSKTAANLSVCVRAIDNLDPDVRMIVINDGLEHHPAIVREISYIPGIRPFIFARNCNLGITAAGKDDIVLMNDDAILKSTLGLSKMQRAAQTQGWGLLSACTNVAGNPAQLPTEGNRVRGLIGPTPGNSFPTVAFVCVFIPRSTIEKVGYLDERFTAYGWDDNDYCRRVNMAGLKIGVHDGCFVDHGSLKSTFRGAAYASGDINEGRRIYLAKWKTI